MESSRQRLAAASFLHVSGKRYSRKRGAARSMSPAGGRIDFSIFDGSIIRSVNPEPCNLNPPWHTNWFAQNAGKNCRGRRNAQAQATKIIEIMKKITLAAALLLIAGAAHALSSINPDYKFRFSFIEPVSFTERGIEFFIFPDGSFDFNTQPSAESGIYYRTVPMNIGYGAPAPAGIRIEHDAMGRIRRVGSVFLNYDHTGRIKRIGTVYMSYNRNALMQIGGLRILYDRRGRVYGATGSVKPYENNAGYWEYNNYAPAPLNEDFYYYRMDGTKAKIEDKK